MIKTHLLTRIKKSESSGHIRTDQGKPIAGVLLHPLQLEHRVVFIAAPLTKAMDARTIITSCIVELTPKGFITRGGSEYEVSKI